jgi:hypothetical protein
MTRNLERIDVEAIASTEPRGDYGQELRERMARVLRCEPDALHPDRERRADA